jgi:hypothetical protein
MKIVNEIESHLFDRHSVRAKTLAVRILFSRACRSLIIADIAFKLAGERPWFSRVLLKATGSWSEFRPSRFCKRLMKDKTLVRESMKHIEIWDFERIIAGHGQNITVNAKAQWHEAFAFLFQKQA